MNALPPNPRGPLPADQSAGPVLTDPFGRAVTYLRLSVTDRCDLRCVYCMAEDMSFLPKAEILSLEELAALAGAFIDLGVRRIRLTGGEPLVRRGIFTLIDSLGARLGRSGPGEGTGLDELTLTTNGNSLTRDASRLRDAGIRRINISLDSRDPARFARITRWGDVQRVLDGIAAAKAAGLAIKINTVALKDENEDELADLLGWCVAEGFDLCLIEAMPVGDVGRDRTGQFLSLQTVREKLQKQFILEESAYRTGGPARYVGVAGSATRLGFITPLSHNFCEGCNRVRLSVQGQLYMCLGQEDAADLRAVLRGGADRDGLHDAIRAAIARKPRGHDFDLSRPAVARHMSATGG